MNIDEMPTGHETDIVVIGSLQDYVHALRRDRLMNANALPAGRQMDALIATTVLKLKLCSADEAITLTNAFFPNRPGWETFYVDTLHILEDPIPPTGLAPLPHYSTDIVAAWEIVEKLQMTITPNMGHPHSNWCADVELKGSDELWLAGAETAPLAICRAALRFVAQSDF